MENKDDDKILIAKVFDKKDFAITKNKIIYTDFLTPNEISLIKKKLKEENVENYTIFGGRKNSDRNIIIFYPEKFTEEMVQKNYDSILKVIRIKLPKEIIYEHREYLSGIMKLGIRREKFGDIIVNNSGADIVCLKDTSNIILDGLKELTRFKKSEITLEKVENIEDSSNEFEEVRIIVSSLRLDNFVSELARTSRTKAKEIIEQDRVFINSICEEKESKKININDIITIRGKGKFIFDSIEGQTRADRIIVNLRKYK